MTINVQNSTNTT